MDPNANLEEQRTLIAKLPDLQAYDRRRLSELRRALQGWLTSGGFEPDWSTAERGEFRRWERKAAKFQDLVR